MNSTSNIGFISPQLRDAVSQARSKDNYVCVSRGTAEMRATWFLVTALGILPAKLLQVGSPAYPLFGEVNVKASGVTQKRPMRVTSKPADEDEARGR